MRSVPLSVEEEKGVNAFASHVAPNPFADHAIVRFTLPSPADVHLVLYDQLGREIRREAGQKYEAGRQSTGIDGGDLPAGMYFYALETSFGTSRGSFMVMK